MCTCALCCGCSLHPSLFPLRSVALLPALPDVFLRVPREAQVQRPARLPLGDRGHFRPRDTPHKDELLEFVMISQCFSAELFVAVQFFVHAEHAHRVRRWSWSAA